MITLCIVCSDMKAMEVPSKVAFIRFRRPDSYQMALHLHDTVMGDRQLRISKVDIGVCLYLCVENVYTWILCVACMGMCEQT